MANRITVRFGTKELELDASGVENKTYDDLADSMEDIYNIEIPDNAVVTVDGSTVAGTDSVNSDARTVEFAAQAGEKGN